jgi:hypothetical protein
MGEQTKTSPAAIEAEIAATRARLAITIDELAVRASPREIARRQVATMRDTLSGLTFTPEGALRPERVGALAAGLAVLVWLVALRRRHRRG